MRAYENIQRQCMRKRGFDRNRLPTIADYYQPIFGDLRIQRKRLGAGALRLPRRRNREPEHSP